jgi:hypothetical protein
MSRRTTVSIIEALTQSNRECARSTPFIDGGLQNPDLHTSGHIVGKAYMVPSSSLWRLCPDHAQTEINPGRNESRFWGFPSCWTGVAENSRTRLNLLFPATGGKS